jgi:hypothetical protein
VDIREPPTYRFGYAPPTGALDWAARDRERVDWADAPAWLREVVEGRLDGRVAEAVTQPAGFTPGIAARLRLDDGRRAFVKAVGPEPNPDSPGIHRAEARTMAALPRSAPPPASVVARPARLGRPRLAAAPDRLVLTRPGSPGIG